MFGEEGGDCTVGVGAGCEGAAGLSFSALCDDSGVSSHASIISRNSGEKSSISCVGSGASSFWAAALSVRSIMASAAVIGDVSSGGDWSCVPMFSLDKFGGDLMGDFGGGGLLSSFDVVGLGGVGMGDGEGGGFEGGGKSFVKTVCKSAGRC